MKLLTRMAPLDAADVLAKDLEFMQNEGLAMPEPLPDTTKEEWLHEHMSFNERISTFSVAVKMDKRNSSRFWAKSHVTSLRHNYYTGSREH